MQDSFTLVNITNTGCTGGDLDTVWVIRLSVSSVSTVLTFVGNLVVILTVYKNKELRSSTNYFIVIMSISDIFMSLFGLLDDSFRLKKVVDVSKLVGDLLCKLSRFIRFVSYGV